MAALEPLPQEERAKADPYVSVMLQHNKAEFLLCTLERGRVMQQLLDLNFSEGEEITIFLNGKGVVHLTGYLMEDESVGEEIDLSEEESSVMANYTSDEEDYYLGKRKKKQVVKPQKKMKSYVFGSDESSAEEESGNEEFILDEAEEDTDEDDEDSNFEENSDEEEYLSRISSAGIMPFKKKPRDKDAPNEESKFDVRDIADNTHSKKKKNSTATPSTSEISKKKKKSNNPSRTDTPKKEKLNQENPQSKQHTPQGKQKHDKGKKSQSSTPVSDVKPKKAKKVLEGGIIAEDIKEGHGPPAKSGKTVHVYYTGRLQNGKVFDSSTSGKPFKFKLGKQEVIRGWDLGLEGMNVGSKRKLTIPARMAYGKQRMGEIPPNSTLIFDVELKAVS